MSDLLYLASKLDHYYEKFLALEAQRQDEVELMFEQTERSIEVQERVAELLEAQLKFMRGEDAEYEGDCDEEDEDEDDCDEEECEEDEEEVA